VKSFAGGGAATVFAAICATSRACVLDAVSGANRAAFTPLARATINFDTDRRVVFVVRAARARAMPMLEA
jgi:uncharacterized membrane protein YdfJ with MMPL/SSD domain